VKILLIDVLFVLKCNNYLSIICFQGLKAAKDIDALVYSETSAKTSESSVRDVMEVAALSSVGTKMQDSSSESSGNRRKSFRKKKTNSMGEAKLAIRKESTKSCSIM